MNRIAKCERKTKETNISLTLNLDGTGNNKIHTGIGFFDHMLDGFARHGLFDLSVSISPSRGTVNSASKLRYGLPDRSTAHSANVSSIGRIMWP